jgi:hypothetical protein
MDMLDGHKSTDTTHAEDEQALRSLLIGVMEAPLLPLTKGLKALEAMPGQIVEMRRELKVVGATANDVSQKAGKLIKEIDEAREILEQNSTEIAGKADSLINSRGEDRQALDALHLDMAGRLETLGAGASTNAASLARMETALLAALDTHTGKISAQMARQLTVLKLINVACLAGIIALSLIVFFRHFLR